MTELNALCIALDSTARTPSNVEGMAIYVYKAAEVFHSNALGSKKLAMAILCTSLSSIHLRVYPCVRYVEMRKVSK